MDDYLSKPFDSKQLRAIIEQWVSGKETAPDDTYMIEDLPVDDGAPIFDKKGLLERLGGEETHLSKLVLKFVKSTDNRLDILRESLEQEKFEEVRLQAHTIRGAAANIGAERMQMIASEIENATKTGLTEIPRLYTSLYQAFMSFKMVTLDLKAE
jgi:HPt (histidine-containing phosphotransfer) domain-containing protein